MENVKVLEKNFGAADQIHSGGEGKTRAAGAQKSTLGLKKKKPKP